VNRVVARLRAVFADPPRIASCDACASVSVCDTTCRAEATRDRNVDRYLTLGVHR
jgi:radical SAM protein with 4Fe4S-binding SPASM domain